MVYLYLEFKLQFLKISDIVLMQKCVAEVFIIFLLSLETILYIYTTLFMLKI